MDVLRQTLVSVALCFVPVLLAPVVGAILFPNTIGKQLSSVDASSAVVDVPAPVEELLSDESGGISETSVPDAAWQAVGHSKQFDPDSASDFVFSLRFRATGPAKLGKRKLFVKKYSQGQKKPVGWAFALKRFDTSVRPEFYINNESGKGEWFTFDAVNLEQGRWLQLFLVRRRDGSTGLLLRREGESSLKFLGGYDTSQLGLSENSAEMFVAPNLLDGADFKGEIAEIALIRPAELPRSEVKLTRLLQEYVKAPEDVFPEEDVKLLVRPNEPLRVER